MSNEEKAKYLNKCDPKLDCVTCNWFNKCPVFTMAIWKDEQIKVLEEKVKELENMLTRYESSIQVYHSSKPMDFSGGITDAFSKVWYGDDAGEKGADGSIYLQRFGDK